MTRGSQWTKWDFHVHTPASVLHNNFGNDWDYYVTQLFKKAIDNEIVAIGITDYCSIEGYKKIRQEYLTDQQKMESLFTPNEIKYIKNILIFPNIELRLKKFVGSSAINFHVFFSDLVDIHDIESNFLHELKFIFSEDTEGHIDTRALTLANLTQFGQRLQSEHAPFQSDPSPLFTGMNNAKVDDIDIVNVLKSKNTIFNKKYFFAIPSDEDLSVLHWNSQDHNDRKLLIQKSHFLMSSNPQTVRWGLGKFNASEEEYIQEFKSIKPTLWGSDAHGYDKLFRPDLNRFTWVKSEHTFEGIRQVLFEPERICIQESAPINKINYQIMKEIRLIDRENNLFQNEYRIGLNSDLNAIIGGKSSGKSLLLYHLAKSTMEVDKFRKLSETDGFQKYDDLPIDDLEVFWEDGHVTRLSESSAKRPVVYIPQMYLNYMAEEKSNNEDFRRTIEEILKGHEGYKEFYDTKKAEILQFEQLIDIEIKNYFSAKAKHSELLIELHQLGDKAAIEANIISLNEQLEALRELAGFSETEDILYKTLSDEIRELTNQKASELLQKELLDELNHITTQTQPKITSFVEEIFSEVKYKYHENEHCKSIIESTVSKLAENLNAGIVSYMALNPFDQTSINQRISSIDETLKQKNEQLEPLLTKIQNMHTFTQKQGEIASETEKLTAIKAKEKEIETQNSTIDIQKFVVPYQELFRRYQSIVEKNSESAFRRISDDIELISEIGFNLNSFDRDFANFIAKNRSLQSIFDDHGFFGNVFKFSSEHHMENIQFILNKVLEGTISFNQGKQIQEIINALFKNYFDVTYDLQQGEDRLAHMSPGKKGIILFQLFLHLSASKDPILIDQPEDNLDNRTVYQELNDFIKKKKIQRQIIIVSHNSNLVVSTDSENVIVAHQNGTGISRPKFEYINGALENTFVNPDAPHLLEKQGIREHVCEILEGGKEAFKKREKKYNLGS